VRIGSQEAGVTTQALNLLAAWNWDPSVIIGSLLLILSYISGTMLFRGYFPHSQPITHAQVWWFLCGVGVIFLALVSPLDEIGDGYLFSAHMLQHMLLMVIAPPMLLLGTPGWLLRPVVDHRTIRPIAHFAAGPIATFVLFNVNLCVWHVPFFYEAALHSEPIHILEHLTFVGTGIITWLPAFSPLRELPQLVYWKRLAYVVVDTFPSMALGWYFVAAQNVIYPTYAAAPRAFALDALNDQFIGGLMMTMPMGLVFLGALKNEQAE
jgi:putative membrane protein